MTHEFRMASFVALETLRTHLGPLPEICGRYCIKLNSRTLKLTRKLKPKAIVWFVSQKGLNKRLHSNLPRKHLSSEVEM